MKIAVLGAHGTGKTSLVAALRLALTNDAGSSVGDSVNECAALVPTAGYNCVLLMGLDLSLHTPAKNSTQATSTAKHDAQLRQQLSQNAVAYTVVYGSGQARTDCALQAIDFHRRRTTTRPASGASGWHWSCDNCSDAACERRVFSALVNRRCESVRQ